MRINLFMDCNTLMDTAYKGEKDLDLLTQIRLDIHLLFCPECAGKVRKLRYFEEILKKDFLPPSPDFEDLVMERLYEETGLEEKADAPAGFSFRGWVIIGFFVLISLSYSFFDINFTEIAKTEGLSFLLPVGLTVGMVVTCYGALFIGSHLKELSARFRLH